MHVQPVDLADRALFARWLAPIRAAEEELWPGQPGWQPEELEAMLAQTGGPLATTGLAVTAADGAVLGSGWLELPLLDNRHLAIVSVFVDPEHRRRGVGSAVLAATERAALEAGRTVLTGLQAEPTRLGGPSPDRRSPGQRFAEALGYSCAQVDVRRDLVVPVPPDRLKQLENECQPYAHDYEVVVWQDRCPEEHVAARALFGQKMSTDAPPGEVPREPERWDAARVRAQERLAEQSNRTVLVAAARHRPTDALVAFTEIALPRGAPQKAQQCDTLVLAAHRGRRLGTLVKVANLRRLAEISPWTSLVTTWNAADNDPMIRVNEALGCVVAGTVREWQKPLGSGGRPQGAAPAGVSTDGPPPGGAH